MFLTDSLWLTILNAQGGKAGGSAPVVIPSPVGWWKIDAGSGLVLADSSGNGGTININGSSNGTWGTLTGFSVPVRNFTNVGPGAFTSNPPVAAQRFTGGTPFSISMWVRYIGSSGAMISTLDGTPSGWRFTTEEVAGKLGFLMLGTGAGSGTLSANGTASLTSNTTYHFVMTYDGAGTTTSVKFYINGVSDAVAASSSTFVAPTSAFVLQLGTSGGGSYDQWQGGLSDVRLFNVALTGPQAAQLFTNGPV